MGYFAPAGTKLPQGDDNFRIVHVANLKPLKDQWTLIKAVEELNKSHKKWRLCVVGADQCGVLGEYKNYIRRKGFSEKVRFIGAMSDIRGILSNADAFVLTSLTEALPMSIIEAIAMGLPCIVTNVGGNSDIIEHGKEGYLVAPGDYVAIAGYMRTLIADPAQRRKMGIAARRKAMKQFDFNTMVARYNDLFSNLLSA
jgi:glycosyltransferase involved in cell wall biosynthesis